MGSPRCNLVRVETLEFRRSEPGRRVVQKTSKLRDRSRRQFVWLKDRMSSHHEVRSKKESRKKYILWTASTDEVDNKETSSVLETDGVALEEFDGTGCDIVLVRCVIIGRCKHDRTVLSEGVDVL